MIFLPVLYNIGTYFAPGLPPVEFYWKHYKLDLGEPFPRVDFRVLPLVLSVTYLCPVDILGSMVVFYLLVVLKKGAMQNVGFSAGDGRAADRGVGYSLHGELRGPGLRGFVVGLDRAAAPAVSVGAGAHGGRRPRRGLALPPGSGGHGAVCGRRGGVVPSTWA